MQRDEASLHDMMTAARRIAKYIEGMTRAEFLVDDKTKAAVVREFTIIGEASTRLSAAF